MARHTHGLQRAIEGPAGRDADHVIDVSGWVAANDAVREFGELTSSTLPPGRGLVVGSLFWVFLGVERPPAAALVHMARTPAFAMRD